MESAPTADRVHPYNVRTNQGRLPPVKGAGATAPEGLSCLKSSPMQTGGETPPLQISDLRQKRATNGRPYDMFALFRRGAFHMPPLKLPQKLSDTDAGDSANAPKVTYQPISSAARRPQGAAGRVVRFPAERTTPCGVVLWQIESVIPAQTRRYRADNKCLFRQSVSRGCRAR